MTNGTINGSVIQAGNDLAYTLAKAGIVTFNYTIRTSNGPSSAAVVQFIVG